MKAISRVFLPVLALFFVVVGPVHAASISVSPSVIDLEAKARDIVKGEIRLKNEGNHKVSVFPDFRDVGVSDELPMAPWVEITHAAIELDPKEERIVPYLIHVNHDASPGYYHGTFWFGEGSFRFEAEKMTNPTLLPVNVKVLDNAIERLQLGTFIADKQVFGSPSASFSFGLQNTGNRTVAPLGNIRIYDQRGREVAEVPANPKNETVSPENKALLAAVWNSGSSFGRYKAVLDLEYGIEGKTINDTVFFWVLPWGKTLSLFTGISVVLVIIAVMLHSRYEARRVVTQKSGDEEVGDNPSRARGAAFFEKLREREQERRNTPDALQDEQSTKKRQVMSERHSVPGTVRPHAVTLTREKPASPDPHTVVRLTKR